MFLVYLVHRHLHQVCSSVFHIQMTYPSLCHKKKIVLGVEKPFSISNESSHASSLNSFALVGFVSLNLMLLQAGPALIRTRHQRPGPQSKLEARLRGRCFDDCEGSRDQTEKTKRGRLQAPKKEALVPAKASPHWNAGWAVGKRK